MKEVTLGIDIGGTNTKFGLVDKQGNCITQNSIPTRGDGNDDIDGYLNYLYKETQNLIEQYNEPLNLIGVGLGAPNGNYFTGRIEHAPNLSFKGMVPLVELFSKYYNLPMVLTNDANAAAIGEKLYGGAQGMDDFLVITLGTGLGSGFVVGGDLVYGHDGFAGELGHTTVIPDGREGGFGKKGGLEAYVSAPGIKRTVFMLMADLDVESSLKDVSFNEMTAEMIADAANDGDRIALEAFEYTGKLLGIKLVDAVLHTSPEAIFLLGGLANAGDLIFKPTIKHFEANAIPVHKNKIKISPSGLKEKNAGILGASALIMKELEKTGYQSF